MILFTTKSQLAGDNLNLNPPFLTMGFTSIRVFDPVGRNYSVVTDMGQGRWYASVVTMADGNLLILGGIQQVSKACQLMHMFYMLIGTGAAPLTSACLCDA